MPSQLGVPSFNVFDLHNVYTPDDAGRINDFLETLTPHLADGGYYIVGSLAVRYHVVTHGIAYPKNPVNDVDIVVSGPEAVSPNIAEDLMISHHHPDKEGDRFYLAVVDPQTKIKSDLFGAIKSESTARKQIGTLLLPIVSLTDQLAAAVTDIQKPANGKPAAPKWYEDAERLLAIADPELAEAAWQRHHPEDGRTLTHAYLDGKDARAAHSELVFDKPFHKPGPYHCDDCIETPEYPLTPLGQVYELLGYIE